MITKYFGTVKAEIDKDERRISLSFMPRGKGQLDKNHPQRCLSWALSALQPYTEKGFVISTPEVSG
jgi:hypothetical protein